MRLILSSSTSNETPFRFSGFELVLCWHFLILFSPIGSIGSHPNDLIAGTLLYEQIALYTSIGFTFLIAWAMRRFTIDTASSEYPSLAFLGAFGAFASLVTFASAFRSLYDPALSLACVCLLGIAEAYLVVLWLCHLTTDRNMDTNKKLAARMTIGAILCFFVQNLQHEIYLFIIVSMPLIASLILWRRRTCPPLSDAKHDYVDQKGEESPPPRIKTRSSFTLVPSACSKRL